MNDEQRALWLEQKRAEAKKLLPTLSKVVNAYFQETKDQEFLDFMQDMIDAYMMHECKLGRSPEC